MICEAVFLFNTWDVRSSLFVCWIYSSLTGKCRVCLVNRFLQWSAGSNLEQLLTSYSLAHSTQYSWSKVCENSSFSSSNFVFMHFLFAGFFLCLLLSIFFACSRVIALSQRTKPSSELQFVSTTCEVFDARGSPWLFRFALAWLLTSLLVSSPHFVTFSRLLLSTWVGIFFRLAAGESQPHEH